MSINMDPSVKAWWYQILQLNSKSPNNAQVCGIAKTHCYAAAFFGWHHSDILLWDTLSSLTCLACSVSMLYNIDLELLRGLLTFSIHVPALHVSLFYLWASIIDGKGEPALISKQPACCSSIPWGHWWCSQCIISWLAVVTCLWCCDECYACQHSTHMHRQIQLRSDWCDLTSSCTAKM